MLQKTPLKRRKGLAKVSPKQAAKDAVWRAIALQKAENLSYICQWCRRILLTYYGYTYSYDGHHIIRRARGRIDEPSNCYVCHRTCHQFITDNNINVRLYPNLEAWNVSQLDKQEKKNPKGNC